MFNNLVPDFQGDDENFYYRSLGGENQDPSILKEFYI